MRLALLRGPAARYLLASVVALGVDGIVFLILLRLGTLPALASALGYGLGVVVHWFISSRFVFAGAVALDGPARLRQQGLFVASALIGLVVTTGVVAVLTRAGLDPRLAKLAAVGAGFGVTWALRQTVVFRRGILHHDRAEQAA